MGAQKGKALEAILRNLFLDRDRSSWHVVVFLCTTSEGVELMEEEKGSGVIV